MDMRKLLEAVTKFAGEPEQKPGDQVRGSEKAKVGGKEHPFKGRLVGDSKDNMLKGLAQVAEDKSLEWELAEAYAKFMEDDLGVEPKRPSRKGSRHARGHEPKSGYTTVKADEEVDEGRGDSKGLHAKVKIVKGPHAGKTGYVRQIKTDRIRNRVYLDLDLEDGGQAVVPKQDVRLVKDLAESYTGRETKDGVWRVFKDGQAVAAAGPFKSAEEANSWIKKQNQGVAEARTTWNNDFYVYDPKTKAVKKKFRTHKGAKQYAEANGLKVASAEYYHDSVSKEVDEAVEATHAPNPALKNILMRHIDEVKRFVASGDIDATSDLFEELYEYFANGIPESVRRDHVKLKNRIMKMITPYAKFYADTNTMNEGDSKEERRANRELYDKIKSKGVVPSIDRERYTDMSDEGLEGPFRNKQSGEILYYDPKAGKYYNRDSDMYVVHGLDEAVESTGIEAYGVKGVKSTPWRKTFKNQQAFERWLDANEGEVEVQGTRDYNAKDTFKEGWESGPEERAPRERDPDSEYDARRQEKLDAEAEKAQAQRPQEKYYTLVGRGPNMEPNYEFPGEYATQDEAVAARARLMADPKTPNPRDIGISRRTRYLGEHWDQEGYDPRGQNPELAPGQKALKGKPVTAKAANSLAKDAFAKAFGGTSKDLTKNLRIREGIESADPIESAVLNAVQELIQQGHTEVAPEVITNMVVAATSQPFLLKDLVDVNNNSAAVQHYVDSINPTKVKFSNEILTVKNEDPAKDKAKAQSGVSNMAARAANRNRLGEGASDSRKATLVAQYKELQTKLREFKESRGHEVIKRKLQDIGSQKAPADVNDLEQRAERAKAEYRKYVAKMQKKNPDYVPLYKMDEAGSAIGGGATGSASNTGTAGTAALNPDTVKQTTAALNTFKSATGSNAPAPNIAKALDAVTKGTAVGGSEMKILEPVMKDLATVATDPKLAGQFKSLAGQVNQTQQKQQQAK